MFRIKVCGITRELDIDVCRRAGVDAIGFNFYSPSPRSVGVDRAARLAAHAGGLFRVGLFVNSSRDEIAQVLREVELDAIQLHGDEPPTFLTQLAETAPRLPLVRAWRLAPGGLDAACRYVDAAYDAGRAPDALLIDAVAPGVYGGSGHRAPWTDVPLLRSRLPDMRLILAGGLTPSNVAEAIRVASPDGVDTASGVESAPGIKDASLVEGFATAAEVELAAR